MLLNILFVTFLAAIGLWKSIPLGFFLEMSPVLVCISSIVGASIGIWIIFFIGNGVKKYLSKVMTEKGLQKKESRLNSLINTYGIPGMGIIATLIVGPVLTMSIGMALVRNTKQLLIWTNVGVIIWSIMLTSIGHIGISLF